MIATWLLLPLTLAAAAAREPRPPVIIVSIDTLRADRVRPDIMPNLSALRGEAVEFSAAYSQATWTLPSHASLFFSQYPRVLDTDTVKKPKAPHLMPRLSDALLDNGYSGITFGELPFFARPYRLESNRVRLNLHETPAPHFDEALEALPRGSSSTFVLLHTYLVHHYKYITNDPLKDSSGTWRCPPVFARFKVSLEAFFLQDSQKTLSCEELNSRYDFAARCFDAQLGTFIESLKRNGVWDRALFTVVSDHGESLCEGPPDAPRRGHGQVGHEELLHVPWLLKLPGGRFAGRRVNAQVGLIDAAPTILAALKLESPATFLGRDLLRPGQETAPPAPVYSEASHWDSVIDGPWRLLRVKGSGDKLFDLTLDPGETRDASEYEPARYQRLLGLLRARDEDTARRKRLTAEPASSRIVDTPPIIEALRRAGYFE